MLSVNSKKTASIAGECISIMTGSRPQPRHRAICVHRNQKSASANTQRQNPFWHQKARRRTRAAATICVLYNKKPIHSRHSIDISEIVTSPCGKDTISNNPTLTFFVRHFVKHKFVPVYQSSSSSLSLCMAFLRASSASAKLPPRLGVGVLLRLVSEPLVPLRLMPESRCCRSAGFLPAAGRLAGGAGGVGLALATGGAGGGRGAGAGAGAACSST